MLFYGDLSIYYFDVTV